MKYPIHLLLNRKFSGISLFKTVLIVWASINIVSAQVANLLEKDTSFLRMVIVGPSAHTIDRHYLIGGTEYTDSAGQLNYFQQLVIIDHDLVSGQTVKHYVSGKVNYQIRLEYIASLPSVGVLIVTRAFQKVTSTGSRVIVGLNHLNSGFIITDSTWYSLNDTFSGIPEYYLLKAKPLGSDEMIVFGTAPGSAGNQKRFVFRYNIPAKKIISEIIKPIEPLLHCDGFSEVLVESSRNRYTMLNYGALNTCYEIQTVDSNGSRIDSVSFSNIPSHKPWDAYFHSTIYSCNLHNADYALSISDSSSPVPPFFSQRLNIRKFRNHRPVSGIWFNGDFDFDFGGLINYAPIRNAVINEGQNSLFVGLMSTVNSTCFISKVDTHFNVSWSGFIPRSKLSAKADRYFVSSIDTINGKLTLIGNFSPIDSATGVVISRPFLIPLDDPESLIASAEFYSNSGISCDVFPNPASHDLTILCSVFKGHDVEISLSSVAGKNCSTYKIASWSGETTIDVNELQGFFILRIMNEAGEVCYKKILVQP